MLQPVQKLLFTITYRPHFYQPPFDSEPSTFMGKYEMILRLVLASFLLLTLSLVGTKADAYELSLSAGHYEPSDGVVNGLYDTSALTFLSRFAIPRDDDLSWSSTILFYDFESRVANLENKVRLLSLFSGFRKKFESKDKSVKYRIEPFFGGGIGIAALFVNAEDESTETHYNETVNYGFATAWELGIIAANTFTNAMDIELKMTDMQIGRKLFGNINIGGRIFSIGMQFSFGNEG